ncbi:MAG: NUDIX domain-containing protein [Candidatus Aenigmarchaeota archaeon]|nr:NUDIX domain-containing protein [Candidatus Aenigmarchaeota archaeon]
MRPVPSASALVTRDDEFLLVKRKYEPSVGKWSLPGGIVEYGEYLETCAAREVNEETNVNIKIKNWLGNYEYISKDFHYVIISYEADHIDGDVEPNYEEVLDARWFKLKEALNLPLTGTTRDAILDKLLADWSLPELPEKLGIKVNSFLRARDVGRFIKSRLKEAKTEDEVIELNLMASDFLYDLVRKNVKRGRIFELSEVLTTKHADCLGYVKLFDLLAPKFGLDLGIVEVIVDNAGRRVPHYVNLLSLPNKEYRFLDAWYGSKNIFHKRIGALVDEKVKDVNTEELSEANDVRGLPKHCIDAIDFYILGNGHLERDELDKAIECYTEAIKLHPNNTRAFFNRAIAYERKGEKNKADLDYKQAFKDETRVQASIEGIEWLIDLDEKGVSEKDQTIYLLHKGYHTGKEEPLECVAKLYGISKVYVKQKIDEIEKKLLQHVVK